MRRTVLRLACTGSVVIAIGLGACSSSQPPGNPPSPTPTAAATGTSPSPSEASAIPEPTTTNTLPPPPAPSKPAASTAGDLTADALPVPPGWKTVARKGGEEEGYLGNGTWVHERDPRYAAFDAITIGCAQVTRDDYADPEVALEGTYGRKGEPGIGLVLEFTTAAKASVYFDLYLKQVEACTGANSPVPITRLDSPTGLIDRRTYDSDWIEVGNVVDRRVTLIILSDPKHDVSQAQAEQILTAIG